MRIRSLAGRRSGVSGVQEDISIGRYRAFCLALGLLVTSCEDGVEFDSRVERPAFASGSGPLVLFDEAHHNRHDIRGTYRPFAEVVRNDGFAVQTLAGGIDAEALGQAKVLVIVTAQSQTETNAEAAFKAAELQAIAAFVQDGGSLLLVTDHYPFPNAVETLANVLGVEVAKGMTFDPLHHRRGSGDDSRLLFSRQNGLLGDHPVTNGRMRDEAVQLVETFTGDAVRAAPHLQATQILKLSDKAVNRLATPSIRRVGGDVVVDVQFGAPKPAVGWAQGLAFAMGKGRVVVLAEAAMITAQEDGGRKLGMNSPGNDNRQFLLNVMRWLGRAY